MLLALTFLMGLGSAFDAPAWQAIIPDLVEREDLPAAVALNATGFNVARALGPALGGIIIAISGPAAVFILNAISFVFVLAAIYRWRHTPATSGQHPEDMLGATAAGMRYVRHAPALRAVLIRVGVFAIGASALWALLPVMARRELNLDATGYGIVLGSLGVGGVTGALLMPRLRRILSVDRIATLATIVFAGATLALAYLRFLPLLVVCMAAGGMAWLAILSNLTVAAQTVSPAWVRARTMGIYLLVFQGLLAVGSFGWGLLAESAGSTATLSVAAATLICGLAAALRWPLGTIEHLDVSPSMHWNDPRLAIIPDPEDGPVLITVEYRVPAGQAGDFIHAMDEMRVFRRREGAVRWDIFRDLEDPDRYIETFIVPTWAEHMRQHARVTVADQEIEARAFAFLQPGVQPVAKHLIAARTYKQDATSTPPYVELS
jgi:predicted MFS family arabinose efflux permease